MKQYIYKGMAVIAAILLTTSCAEEYTTDGNGDNGKTPLAIGALDVSSTTVTGRATGVTGGSFVWNTDNMVKIIATPVLPGTGKQPYTCIYSYNGTAWAAATGEGYENNLPIYRENVDGEGEYTFTAETWGGQAALATTTDANGVAALVPDQSTTEAYQLSDYIFGAAMLNAHDGTLYADGSNESSTLDHRTVDVVITIHRGSGWGDTDNANDITAANTAFIAYMNAVAAAQGFKLYAEDSYQVLPLAYTDSNNDGTHDTDTDGKAIITLRAHIPVSSLPGTNGQSNISLLKLTPQASEGQITLPAVFGTYTRPEGLANGSRLTVSFTYSHLKGLSDATATLGNWTPVEDLPDMNGGYQIIPGYDVVILTPEDLAKFAAAVNAGEKIFSLDKGKDIKAGEACVVQVANIDLNQLKTSIDGKYKATADNWIPIGTPEHPFYGKYYGANRTIKGLKITSIGAGIPAGLFGVIRSKDEQPESYNSVIYTRIIDANITLNSSQARVGLLAGYAVGNGAIQNCQASGTINVITNGDACVGGLIGHSGYDLTKCYTKVTINAEGSAGNPIAVGGLAGKNSASIIASAADTPSKPGITVNSPKAYVGGLVGFNTEPSSLAFASFAVSDITISNGSEELNAGGLVGRNNGIFDSSYALGEILAYGTTSNIKIGAICGNNISTQTVDYCYGAGITSTVINNVADSRTDGMGTSNLPGTDTMIYGNGQTPSTGSILKAVQSNMHYRCFVPYLTGNSIQITYTGWYAAKIWVAGSGLFPSISGSYLGEQL